MKQLLPIILYCLPLASLAQAPTITTVAPRANTAAAPRTSSISITLSQPITPASANALQVFGSERGGRRTATTPALASGNTLSLAPGTTPWLPGELIQYSVTRSVTGTGGALTRPWVGRFRAAAGGTGTGNFQAAPDVLAGAWRTTAATGDLDGDGDLDFVTGDYNGSTVGVRLNAGNATFSAGADIVVSERVNNVQLADVDGDGDLDLVAAGLGIYDSGGLSVRLNNGWGVFGAGQEVSSSRTIKTALADLDGDGDLDILALGFANVVYVYLNNGRGVFNSAPWVSVGEGPFDLAVGDVDNDGDLDLLTANNNTNTVSVRLNNGSGVFGGDLDVVAGRNPKGIIAGDLDNDGDLDFITVNNYSGSSPVQLNAGNGTFTGGQLLDLDSATSLVLADVNHDGALDLLTTTVSTPYAANVRLNDGNGTFGSNQLLRAGNSPQQVVPADLDGDGDVDLLVANDDKLSVYLNGGTVLTDMPSQAASTPALFPNPARHLATLTGAAPLAAVAVLDALGRPVMHTTANAAGTASLLLPAELPAGVYLVRSGSRTTRLLVE